MPPGKRPEEHSSMKKNRGNSHPFARILVILLFAVLLLACAYWLLCLSRPGLRARLQAKSESSIRVATININAFRYLKTPEDASEYLLSLAGENDIDVMFLQEYYQSKWFSDEDFRALMAQEYDYVITDGEQAVISRYPILDYELTTFPSSSNTFLTAHMEFNGEPVTMISVHLQTTGFNAVDDEAKTSLALGYVLKANEEVRSSQATALRSVIDASEYPVIVAGDFNSVPYSKVYRLVKKNTLKDTYLEKGKGKGATYRMLQDILRIDYVLHDNSFSCIDCVICEDYISDHRMVISTLKKK